MVKICPVSLKQINENLSRLNATFTVIMSVLFVLTSSPVFVLVLTADFILRNLLEGRFNPVIRLNKYIIQVVHLPRHMINAGPKIFAARLGLMLSLLGSFFLFTGNPQVSVILVGVLALFSFMEAAFNFCVACKLYPYVLPLNRIFN